MTWFLNYPLEDRQGKDKKKTIWKKEYTFLHYMITEKRKKRSQWSEVHRMVVHLRQLFISKFFSLSLWCSVISGSPTIYWMARVCRARPPLSMSHAVRGCVCVWFSAHFYLQTVSGCLSWAERVVVWLVDSNDGAGVKFHHKMLQC